MRTYIYTAVYVSAICLANFLVFFFGPVWSLVNSFLLIGLDFILRDKLHEIVGIKVISLLVLVAGVLSYVINPAGGMIALASFVAFTLASLTDGAVYQLYIRKPWLVKSNASNSAASVVDSVVFPVIAFGAFMPVIILGQFAAKVVGGVFWSWVLRKAK